MRRRRRRKTARATSAQASTEAPPTRPRGQGADAPGTAAPVRATHTSHAVGRYATKATARAIGRHTGPTAAAITPSTVAGGTAGAASRLAGTDSNDTRAKRTAMYGVVIS